MCLHSIRKLDVRKELRRNGGNMEFAQLIHYTEEDYYNSPEDVRAELIDGQFYDMASPSTASHDYIRKLKLYADAGVKEYWIVDPNKKSVYVYHLEEDKFEVTTFTFQDKIKANIYEDLWIAFTELPT